MPLMVILSLIFLLTVPNMVFSEIMPQKAIRTQIRPIVGKVLKDKYTDEDYVRAIYLAEGGYKAQYPYGIRSVHCDSRLQCKRCCETTVRNNRSRFAKHVPKGNTTYLEYLAHRYCPVGGRNATQAELRLNKNWIVNVKWFLEHPHNA